MNPPTPTPAELRRRRAWEALARKARTVVASHLHGNRLAATPRLRSFIRPTCPVCGHPAGSEECRKPFKDQPTNQL